MFFYFPPLYYKHTRAHSHTYERTSSLKFLRPLGEMHAAQTGREAGPDGGDVLLKTRARCMYRRRRRRNTVFPPCLHRHGCFVSTRCVRCRTEPRVSRL